jgi:hypothetical protein
VVTYAQVIHQLYHVRYEWSEELQVSQTGGVFVVEELEHVQESDTKFGFVATDYRRHVPISVSSGHAFHQHHEGPI